ncbi:MAG: hypothetical protein HDQ99_16920 [Lachnospiraceae bacterium]|nr:hypothetical protein [Lachnospiraceae bacterium]
MRYDESVAMQRIKLFVSSFLALFAVMRLTGMETKNPLSIVIFILFLCFNSKFNSDSIKKSTMREHLTAAVPAFLFCMFTLAARYKVILGTLTSRLFCVVVLLFTFLGLFLIYFYFSTYFLQAAGRLHITGNTCSLSWLSSLTVIFCLFCWSFYFLYEYPGIMTPDSINQYAQIIGAYELSNHHSIVHTALIGLFYNIGLFFTGSSHFGLALYTLAQMFFMALVAGYVVKTMQKAKIITPVIVVTILFYALIPYNGIYAVTIWKDIPFAGCFTLFSAALLRFLLRENTEDATVNAHERRFKDCFTLVIPYVFSGVMICLLRTNGWYAFLAALPFILLVYKKNWRTMIPIHVVILLLVLVVKYPMMQIYDIKQADFAESLSIPVQQIARVVALGEEMNEEQKTFVENIMDVTKVAKVYREDVSDGIKNLIRENGIVYLEAHKGAFFKNWFMIGLSHPNTYFDAFVAQTIGFWYPDVSYEVGLADGIYPNEFELHWQPVLRGKLVVKVREILFKLHELLPLYGVVWSMGFMLWILILTIALSFRNRQPANALIGLPVLLLILTLIIATPVATEFRYAYALFFGMPVFLTAPFVKGKMWKSCTL